MSQMLEADFRRGYLDPDWFTKALPAPDAACAPLK